MTRRELGFGLATATVGTVAGWVLGRRSIEESIPGPVDCLITSVSVDIFSKKALEEHNQIARAIGYDAGLFPNTTTLGYHLCHAGDKVMLYSGDGVQLGETAGITGQITIPKRYMGNKKFRLCTKEGQEIRNIVIQFLTNEELLMRAVEATREYRIKHQAFPAQVCVKGPGDMYVPEVVHYTINGIEALTEKP